jgi:hypothetical protein
MAQADLPTTASRATAITLRCTLGAERTHAIRFGDIPVDGCAGQIHL